MKIAFGNSEFDVSRYLVPANPGTRININVTMNSIEFALTKEYREALSPWQVLPQPTSRCTNCGWVTRASTEMESMAMLEDSGIQHDLELPESDSEYDTDCEEERDLLAVTPASLSDVGEVVGHMFQDDTPLANQPGLPILPNVLPATVGVSACLLPVPSPVHVALVPPVQPVSLPPGGGGGGDGGGGGGDGGE